MTRGYVPLLLTLALVWGASYLFIKPVDEIEPTTMMFARCVVAAALPVPFVLGQAGLDEPLTAAAVGGLTLILLGVALGSGAVRLSRREPAPATPHG